MGEVIELQRVDCQEVYDALRIIILAKIGEPGGGYAALGALATLLGEFVLHAPADMRATLKAEALEIFEKALLGEPLLVMRH